jgi:thiol-disulfide isomerase/thioredoxin
MHLRAGWRRAPLGVLVVTVMAASVSGCGLAAPSVSTQGSSTTVDGIGVTAYPVQQRVTVPNLAGTTLRGPGLSLANFGRGKIVFLNVWASWCTQCRQESSALRDSAIALAAQGVRFLGLDEQDVASDARAYLSSTGITYPQVIDGDGALLARLRMLPQMGIPSTLVIDRHGRVAARVIGPVTSSEIRQIVRNLAAEN